jgi:Zn-dependent peptidase ImmA (M78 family)
MGSKARLDSANLLAMGKDRVAAKIESYDMIQYLVHYILHTEIVMPLSLECKS